MSKWLLLFVGLLHVFTASTVQREPCVIAVEGCRKSFDCAFSYLSFIRHCPHIVDQTQENIVKATLLEKPSNCSEDCVKAIKELKYTKEGTRLYDCDAQLDGDWLTIKARVNKCLNPNVNNGGRLRCTMVRINCTRDKTCRELQVGFLNACGALISGVSCEKKCLKAQGKLFSSEHGKGLSNCECDGPSETFCRGIQAHAEHLRCIPGHNGTTQTTFVYRKTIHDSEEPMKPENIAGVPSASHLLSFMLTIVIMSSLL